MNLEREKFLQGVKCMIVGDSESGKTSLFCGLMRRDIPSDYQPTVFDILSKEVEHAGCRINLSMWDSGGNRLFDSIRPISYAHTDCFLICFARNNPDSLTSIVERWYPEILRHGDGPTVPLILVETKVDLDSKVESSDVDAVRKAINAQFLFHTSMKNMGSATDEILRKTVELAWTKKIDEEKPTDPIWKFHNLTFLVLGDSGVGKTSLINNCIIQNEKSTTVGMRRKEEGGYEEFYHDVVIDDSEYFLRFVEVQLDGSCCLSDLKKTDALILCYAVNDPFSFQSIANLLSRKELENLRQNSLPIFLIGTKSDLQEESDIIIPTEDGFDLKQRMSLSGFLECSTTTSKSSDVDLVKMLVETWINDNKEL